MICWYPILTGSKVSSFIVKVSSQQVYKRRGDQNVDEKIYSNNTLNEYAQRGTQEDWAMTFSMKSRKKGDLHLSQKATQVMLKTSQGLKCED